MTRRSGELSPLEAYDLAERQKRQIGEAFRARILRLHSILAKDGPTKALARRLRPASLRREWQEACRNFASAPADDPVAIAACYRDVVMRHGLKRVDPLSIRFGRDLREFHRNYVASFPLLQEQESRNGFRRLWQQPARPDGYQEVGYSVLCPLTARYIMGLNFTIQPRSNSVHFIYGFINPLARTLGGFSVRLIALMQEVGSNAIAAHYTLRPEDQPPYMSGAGPLILFEKNRAEEMSLADILMDTAGIDVNRPPLRGYWLATSAISPNIRDLVWHRRGGRTVGYNYLQPSLDGVVRVPGSARDEVITYLNRAPLDAMRRRRAVQLLEGCLGRRMPGCTTLDLCAFVEPGVASVPAEQIRRSVAIFQGNSVVKDPDRVEEDIYFQAQMASLEQQEESGRVSLAPITPAGVESGDFLAAERRMRHLLAGLSWTQLQAGRERSYGTWLRQEAADLDKATA
jgi:hypothetical protein